MRIQKLINANIIIKDPIMFAMDYENNILQKINEKYIGKNFQKLFIDKIIKITYLPNDNIIRQDTNNGSSIAHVEFVAEGITFNCGDVVPCCKIIKKDNKNSIISAIKKFDNNLIIQLSIRLDNTLDSLKIGQFINIQIYKSVFPIYQNKILGQGVLFTYLNLTNIYFIKDKQFNNDESDNIQFYLDYIEQLNNDIQNTNNTNIDFFKNILYPFKVEKSLPVNTKQINFIKLLNDNKIIGGYYSLGMELDRTEPDIIKYNKKPNEIITRNKTTGQVFIEFLIVHINYLEILLDMCNTYTNLDDHKNLWKIYEYYKK